MMQNKQLQSVDNKTPILQTGIQTSYSQKQFNELMTTFLTHPDNRSVQQVSGQLYSAAITQPRLLKAHYKKMIQRMNAPKCSAGMRRNILRIFDRIPKIPKAYHGVLMDCCFNYISDPREAIAVQAFALGILKNLTQIYPEVLPELIVIIEERMPHASPAFKSRAKKILNHSSRTV